MTPVRKIIINYLLLFVEDVDVYKNKSEETATVLFILHIF